MFSVSEKMVPQMSTPKNHSVVKAFKIMMAFRGEGGRLTLSEVVKHTKLSMPTAHRFLRTLVSVGALEVEPDGRYQLGHSIKLLGSFANSHADLDSILYYHAKQLSYLLHETVHVAILSGEMARYACKVECSRSLPLASKVGTGLELYCTGVGKVLLAHVSNDRLMKYVESGEFIKLTDNTIVDPTKIMAELENIKARGYAVDDEEFQEGLRCLAVPVNLGEKTFALSVSGPTSRIRTDDVPEMVEELTRRAKLIQVEVANSIC
jgi:DNA-binding IclR family transcriptional regulator